MTPDFDFPASQGHGVGKMILLGEHAVVHARPALAASLQEGVRVRVHSAPRGNRLLPEGSDPRLAAALTIAAQDAGIPPDLGLRLEIETELPVGAGLGSSAALAVALVRALAAGLSQDPSSAEVMRRANEIEKIFHGTPSGIDTATATLGGVLRFKTGSPPSVRAVSPNAPFSFLLIDTETRRATSATVATLGDRRASAPDLHDSIFDAIQELVDEAEGCLTEGKHARLGSLLTENHRFLRELGVSTGELDATVRAALDAGALGAKLTGGGGGGAVLALAGDVAADATRLADALKSAGFPTWLALLGEGVRESG